MAPTRKREIRSSTRAVSNNSYNFQSRTARDNRTAALKVPIALRRLLPHNAPGDREDLSAMILLARATSTVSDYGQASSTATPLSEDQANAASSPELEDISFNITNDDNYDGETNNAISNSIRYDGSNLPPVSPPRWNNDLDITIDLTDSPAAASSPDEISPTPNAGEISPTALPGESRIRCPVCLDSLPRITSTGRTMMSTVCGHIFCSSCLPVCIRTSGRCPTCRKVLRPNQMHPIFI